MSYAKLNNPAHIFVIAEAGSNWKCGAYEEDLKRAHQLIDVAVKAGADAVKFQTYKPETIYVPDAGTSQYLSEHGINENINDIFRHLSMPYEMIPDLAKYCKQKNIMFMSTPFSVLDAKEVDPFVEIHKVASFEKKTIEIQKINQDTARKIIYRSDNNEMYMEEMRYVVDCLNGRKNNIIGLDESIKTIAISLAAKKSGKVNRPIPI